MEVVRPDIINSNLLINAIRSVRKDSKPELINIDQIKSDNPSVHKELPSHLVISPLTLAQIFSGVSGMDSKDMLLNFSRDWDYTTEFIIWNVIACSYLDFLQTYEISFGDIPKKRDALHVLIQASMNIRIKERTSDEYPTLTNEQIEELELVYLKRLCEAKLV